MSDNKKITMYIYKTTTGDGDVYIGKRTLRRLNDTPETENYYGSGVKIHQLLQEHPKDFFTKEILYTFNGTYDEIAPKVEQLERETILLAQLKYKEHCLNKYISSAGVKLTPEIKAKMSASHKGKHHSQETKDKIAQGLKGNHNARLTPYEQHKRLLDAIFNAGA